MRNNDTTDNYPDDIRSFDGDPRSPFYNAPPCECCGVDFEDCDCCEECHRPMDECQCEESGDE